MKLGLLTTSYPVSESDSAGRFAAEMIDDLVRRGHEVEALFAEHPRCDHPRSGAARLRPLRYAWPRGLQRSFYGAGVPDNVRAAPSAALLLPSYAARLALAAKRSAHRWEGVVAHFLLPSGIAAASLGLPCVAIAHSADLHLLERLPGRRSLARHLDARSRLWFVSGEARERFESILGSPLRTEPIVSPMGVTPLEPMPTQEARRRLGLEDASLVVAALTRLVPVKGLDVAIHAVQRVEGAALIVGGEGPLAASLQARARAAEVDLRLLGPLGSEGKRVLFGAADVFVVPSRTLPSGRTEGVPVALLEARAAGLSAVASRVGGITGAFASDPGVTLVPEGDPEALAAAMLDAARSAPPRSAASTWSELSRELERSLRGERRRSSSAANTGRCGLRRSGRSGGS